MVSPPGDVSGEGHEGQQEFLQVRKTRENVGLLLNGTGALVMKEMEKAKVLSVFFTSSLLVRPAFRNLRPLQVVEKSEWSKEDIPLVDEHQVREHLNKPYEYKPTGPDGMHTSDKGAGWCYCKVTLNYLLNIIVIWEVSWWLEWSNCHSYLQEG